MNTEPAAPTPWLEKIPELIHELGTLFSYFYLLRIPVLMMLALIGLPVLAYWSATDALAGNLFVLTPLGVFFTMMAAFMLSWSILVVARVVLLNGERFGVDQALTTDTLSWRWVVTMFALTTPMLAAAVLGPVMAPNWPYRLLAGLLGLLAAYITACVALLVSVLVSPKYRIPADQRFPNLIPGLKTWLKRAYNRPILSPSSIDELGKFGRSIPEDLRKGYLDSHTGLLFPGHWFSLLMLLASLLLFWWIGFWKRDHLGETDFPVPAIAYVLLLLLVINWMLSMAAFFLDRFRIPLILPIAILCFIGNKALRSDHYYSVQRGVSIDTIHPCDVLTKRPQVGRPSDGHPHGRAVVIATAGGGIQAAAWTAKVLTGLERELPEFAESIVAISAVSGGAVGTMYFVNQYRDETAGFPRNAPDISRKIVDDAQSSSLDDVAWALVYSDFFRIFLPYFKRSADDGVTADGLTDRGWALEQTWRNRANIQAYLSNWRRGVIEGWRPAVIFNSTIAETGQSLLLSTTDLAPGTGPDRAQTFSGAYPNTDLPVVTAVRLAATFPYVTPAARQPSAKAEHHLVDGGYYDNYGVFALLNWLEDALEPMRRERQELPDILFIQIRSFPSDAISPAVNMGWFYQTYAPLDALFNVRTNQQRVRDQYELRRFGERWSLLGGKISAATFQFEDTGAPLSWAMNERQICAIQQQWSERLNGGTAKGKPGCCEQQTAQKVDNSDYREVRCFFRPSEPACKDRPAKAPW